jgi:uncharacterized membrane protein
MSESTRTGAGDLQATAPSSPVAEPRWPIAAAILGAILLQLGVPSRGRVPGWWVFPVLEIVLLGVLLARDPGRIDRRSGVMRRLMIALVTVMTIGTVSGLIVLVYDILAAVEGINATALFGRGGAIWVTNVIVFSLWYWAFDRGGAAERAAGSPIPPSFAFPENAMPEFASQGWAPRYPDYLFLSFTNATAFSPTDTLPVRTWAKMIMMIQAAVSLLTAVLVVARAINVLPG